jgi:hypothetical protein
MGEALIFMGIIGWLISVLTAYALLAGSSSAGEKPPIFSAIRMKTVKEIGNGNGIGSVVSFLQKYFSFLFLVGVGFQMFGDQIGLDFSGGIGFSNIVLGPLALGAYILGRVKK